MEDYALDIIIGKGRIIKNLDLVHIQKSSHTPVVTPIRESALDNNTVKTRDYA